MSASCPFGEVMQLHRDEKTMQAARTFRRLCDEGLTPHCFTPRCNGRMCYSAVCRARRTLLAQIAHQADTGGSSSHSCDAPTTRSTTDNDCACTACSFRAQEFGLVAVGCLALRLASSACMNAFISCACASLSHPTVRHECNVFLIPCTAMQLSLHYV
jgi:hypothetical protein